MSAELQDLIDDLAGDLRRAVSIEDPRWRLLAYSAQGGEVDAVRQSSIMTRRAPPEVATYLDSLALDRAETLTHVTAPDLGMQPRTCLTVRKDDLALGFLWVLDGPEPLRPREAARLTEAGEAVAEALWERRLDSDARRGRRAEIVEQLVAGGDHERATVAVAEELGWPAEGPYVVALATDAAADVGDHARRHWHHGELLTGQWQGSPVVIARLTGAATSAELTSVLHGGGAGLAGAGGVVDSLAAIGESLEQATLAIRVARARDSGPTVCFDDLDRGWRLVAQLWLAAGQPGPPAPIRALEAHSQAAALLDTLEATLDSDGDVTAAAAGLHMHRATLYRRLERIEQITGLDLSKSDDRLLAHVGLRLRRLSRAGA